MPATHTPCIINLDSLENAGTVGFVVLHLTITSLVWYFDSFGMGYPEEFTTSYGKQILYNSSQYQNIKSVLCGYYCLYFLHQWSLKKDYYDILQPFSLTDTMFNEKFIKKYFS